ncbi:hypothetical protein MBLNU457_5005t1 [Dothideomycetes sp. NU457]
MDYLQISAVYRCWSPRSVGQLRSGKLIQGSQATHLNYCDVIKEFRKHRDELNQEPTALVAVTNNFLKVLHQALKLTWRGIAPNDIVIAFIAPGDTPLWDGLSIVKAGGYSEAMASEVAHDFFFTWEIPAEKVVHTVTLGTVLRRGGSLGWKNPDLYFHFYENLEAFVVPEKYDQGEKHGKEYSTKSDPYGKGYRCGLDACDFGLRAPVKQIASALSAYGFHLSRAAPAWWLDKLVEGMEDAIHATVRGCEKDLESPEPGSAESKLLLEFQNEYWRLFYVTEDLLSLLKSLPKDDYAALNRTQGRIAEALEREKELMEEFYTDVGY